MMEQSPSIRKQGLGWQVALTGTFLREMISLLTLTGPHVAAINPSMNYLLNACLLSICHWRQVS